MASVMLAVVKSAWRPGGMHVCLYKAPVTLRPGDIGKIAQIARAISFGPSKLAGAKLEVRDISIEFS